MPFMGGHCVPLNGVGGFVQRRPVEAVRFYLPFFPADSTKPAVGASMGSEAPDLTPPRIPMQGIKAPRTRGVSNLQELVA